MIHLLSWRNVLSTDIVDNINTSFLNTCIHLLISQHNLCHSQQPKSDTSFKLVIDSYVRFIHLFNKHNNCRNLLIWFWTLLIFMCKINLKIIFTICISKVFTDAELFFFLQASTKLIKTKMLFNNIIYS